MKTIRKKRLGSGSLSNQSENLKDDARIRIVQEAFGYFNIYLDRPCPGTLAGITGRLIEGSIHKHECLASGDDVVLVFQDTKQFPEADIRRLEENVVKVNMSDGVSSEKGLGLRFVVSKPDSIGCVTIRLIATLLSLKLEDFSLDFCKTHVQTILLFARLHWPE